MNPLRPLLRLVPALLFVLMIAAGRDARAQVGGGPVWVPLDGAPPGTPASVTVDPANSSATQTTIILVCHGFFAIPRTAPDGSSFTEIDAPGLQKLSVIGAPNLPILRKSLAIPTNTPGVALISMTPLAPAMSFSYHVWPLNQPGFDDSLGATPPIFTLDPAIYAMASPYPAAQGMAGPIKMAFGSIPSSAIECYPFQWTPLTNNLMVVPISRWVFSHDGPIMVFDAITQDRNRLANLGMTNWGSVVQYFPPSLLHYQGEYLFIYPSAYAAAIKPLVNQKFWRGWNVTTMTTESIGAISCDNVRTAIKNWYGSTPSSHDHDCLLVGDISNIPYCGDASNTDPRSDDAYGSVSSATDEVSLMERDVFVGRLPGFSASDISNQVTKIINYEDHPPGPLYYGDVILVAHKDDPNAMGYGNYADQQDTIRFTSYKVSPSFTTYYGNDASKTNAGLTAFINSGMGLVAYRGHGWKDAWPVWNKTGTCAEWGSVSGECWQPAQISALSNSPLNPIVWAIACDNTDLSDGNCIGRAWMTKSPGGAVAHYGATRSSATQDNTVLNDSLFMAVWTYGVTNIAHATTFAEDQAEKYNWGFASDNAFEYNLFGDPDMNIRRNKPPIWQTVFPAQITLLPSGQQGLDIQVADAFGAPVQNALIGIFKPSSTPGVAAWPATQSGARPAAVQTTGEVGDNAYTGADGHAHFLIAPQTPGFLYFTVRDSGGGSVADSIPVVGAAAVGGQPLVSAGLWAAPSVTHGATTLHFGRPLDHQGTVTIFDAAGRTIATLPAPAGSEQLEWSGRDASGALARSGLYFARLDVAGERRLARIAVRH